MSEKHQSRKSTLRSVLLLTLLLFSILSYAQNESPADTVVLSPSYDSVPGVMDKEATFDESSNDDDDEVEDSETTGHRFIPKWMPGSRLDTFRLRKADIRLLRNDDAFWYANNVFEKVKEKKSFTESSAYQTILWLFIIGAFIAVLVIYLANSNISLFRKSRSIHEVETDAETEDIFAINYDKEIAKAIALGNHRLGVRLLFLKLLRGLSDKNVIQYAHDRTNFDYLLQVYHAPWYQHFFRLTRHYEYVWYGQFEIDSTKFDIINKDFSSFDRQLSQS